MPSFDRDGTSIHYVVFGTGHPVLLFAPGGMRSSVEFWERTPWNPIRELSSQFRVIAMDQRNAGRSRAPVTPRDGWQTYTADHLALLDHLGVDACHLLGGCIGSSYCLGLIQAAPARVTAAVLQQPIGLAGDNRDAFHGIFDSWAEELRKVRPDVESDALAGLRENFYGGDFVFNVSREWVAECPVPLLVLRGNDVFHPSATSEEIVRLAPRAELVESWKEGPDVARAVGKVLEFFQRYALTRP